MSLTRAETVEGLESEWAALEDFIRGLSEEDMESPTRCEEWTVRNIAAHLVGGVSDLAAGTVGVNTSGNQQVAERSSQTGPQLADELHASAEIAMKLLRAIDDHYWAQPSPFPGLTVRQGVEALWLESFLHEDDIRHAAGRPERPEPGIALEVSLRHVAEEMGDHGWNRTTLELDGMPKIRIGPGGDPITGDPMKFLLAATGRIPAEEIGLDQRVNIYRS
jgi:uncharacterized protein (TIGR03083 family)